VTWRALRQFEPFARQQLGFLERDFAFRYSGAEEMHGWGERLVYEGATTAVEVTYSIEFRRVEVELVRLVDGRRPPHPIFASAEPQLHHFQLDFLLKRRSPELLAEINTHATLGSEDVRASLQLLAAAVRRYAADVLRGDFTVLGEMEAELRSYFAEHPQQIEIWGPHGSSADQTMLDRVKANFPTIPVVTREYIRRHRRASWLGRLRSYFR
jgi:hypothetical protein